MIKTSQFSLLSKHSAVLELMGSTNDQRSAASLTGDHALIALSTFADKPFKVSAQADPALPMLIWFDAEEPMADLTFDEVFLHDLIARTELPGAEPIVELIFQLGSSFSDWVGYEHYRHQEFRKMRQDDPESVAESLSGLCDVLAYMHNALVNGAQTLRISAPYWAIPKTLLLPKQRLDLAFQNVGPDRHMLDHALPDQGPA